MTTVFLLQNKIIASVVYFLCDTVTDSEDSERDFVINVLGEMFEIIRVIFFCSLLMQYKSVISKQKKEQHVEGLT